MEDKDILINKDFLELNGFERSELFNGSLIEYVSTDGTISFIEISNTIGRDWHVRIDNDDYETIGTLDVSNLDQVKKFMNLCECEYNWKTK